MRLDYDAATDSLYIHLSERPSADAEEVAEGVVLDFDENGALVGIDVQHASRKAEIRRLAIHHMRNWRQLSVERLNCRPWPPAFH